MPSQLLGRADAGRLPGPLPCDLLGRLEGHGALLLDGDAEPAELEPGRALADAKIDAAVGEQVERGDAFRCARGMIVARDHLADAVAKADVLGQGRRAGQEHLGRGGMRVFVAEMMLDLPGVVVAEPVGQDDLIERLLEEAMLVAGRPRLLELQP